jgi:hypothetical protein
MQYGGGRPPAVIVSAIRTQPVPQRDRSNSKEMMSAVLIQSLTVCEVREFATPETIVI